ncbi:hypothetical protein FAES_3213 [Fibrella aestuarina BUZ 2]|uniref:Uncharacterized protein n=1 Tax=Fibrella aestuarina BUZ 2 TaxID=1166018 RepID=I0KAR9_9BACT|nr:DUF4494 family protein [Fibrella aestuarina]CCH01222.1 hypothetical protein FAES_3213 [Fibrella aestuarina BUZ 2]
MNWYTSKIRFRWQNAKGDITYRNEVHLHDGTSLVDVANQTLVVHLDRMKNPMNVGVNVASKYRDVHFQVGGKYFFDVTCVEEDDEGRERTFTCLVAADKVSQAEERAERAYRDNTSIKSIAGAKRSGILTVYHPTSDQWISDFKNRSEALADKRYVEYDEKTATAKVPKRNQGQPRQRPSQLGLFGQ